MLAPWTKRHPTQVQSMCTAGWNISKRTLPLCFFWLAIKARKRKVLVSHFVDTNTHLQNAIFLKRESSRDIWYAFIESLASVYVGYPKTIKTWSRTAFTSAEWKKCAEMTGMSLEISGNESHSSLGVGEGYHNLLRKIFKIAWSEYLDLGPERSLRCAVKGITDTMGTERLVQSYLIFEILPRFPWLHTVLPSPTTVWKRLLSQREKCHQSRLNSIYQQPWGLSFPGLIVLYQTLRYSLHVLRK